MNDHTVIQSAPGLTGDSGQQPLKVGTLIEGFEIRGIIGLGGFGIVYEAWDCDAGTTGCPERVPAWRAGHAACQMAMCRCGN